MVQLVLIVAVAMSALVLLTLIVLGLFLWRKKTNKRLGRVKRRISIIDPLFRKGARYGSESARSSWSKEGHPLTSSVQFSSVMPSIPSQVSTGPISTRPSGYQSRSQRQHVPRLNPIVVPGQATQLVITNPSSPDSPANHLHPGNAAHPLPSIPEITPPPVAYNTEDQMHPSSFMRLMSFRRSRIGH